MGLRGPVPKPTALKKAAGNPGRRQLNENEPVPPSGEITPPPWVTGRALEIWNTLAPVCKQMRTLTTADTLTFGRYCLIFARWLELHQECWTRGPAGTTWVKRARGAAPRKKDGQEQERRVDFIGELPYASELRKLLEQLVRLEDRFGLNSAARSRISIHLQAPAPSAAPVNTARDHDDELRRRFLAGGGPAAPRIVGRGG